MNSIPATPKQEDQRRALGIKGVAETLSVSADSIRRLIRDGKLRTVRLGRRVLVPVAEVERVLAGR